MACVKGEDRVAIVEMRANVKFRPGDNPALVLGSPHFEEARPTRSLHPLPIGIWTKVAKLRVLSRDKFVPIGIGLDLIGGEPAKLKF